MRKIDSVLDFRGLGCEGHIPIIYIKVPENMSFVLMRKAEISLIIEDTVEKISMLYD